MPRTDPSPSRQGATLGGCLRWARFRLPADGSAGKVHPRHPARSHDSAVTVPTLLMQGADTWEPMPSTLDALAAALPDVRRISWPGQSHFVTSTAPDLVADALRRFFAEVAG